MSKRLSEEFKVEDTIQPVTNPVMAQALKDEEEKEDKLKEISEPAEKLIDEINNPKKDIFKIKKLTEKIHLDEELDDVDYFDLVHDIYRAILKVLKDYSGYTINDVLTALGEVEVRLEDGEFDIPVSEELQLSKAYSSHQKDLFSKSSSRIRDGQKIDESLDEAVPSDLMNAYKKRSNFFRRNPKVDWQNSEYREIKTLGRDIKPVEALEILKTNPTSLRVLISNGYNKQPSLVTFKEDGKPSSEYKVEVYGDKVYVTSGGVAKNSTRRMPPSYIFQIADKIYVADEKEKDPNLLAQRRENPESPNFKRSNLPNVDNNYNLANQEIRGGRTYTTKQDILWRKQRIDSYQQQIDNLQKYIDEHPNEDHSRDLSRIDYYKEQKDRYLADMKRMQGEIQDWEARRRYLTTENDLRRVVTEYKELRQDLQSAKRGVQTATANLENTKEKGSPENNRLRRDLADVKESIRKYEKQLALLEVQLLDADEEDERAVAAAQARLDSAQNNLDRIQARLSSIIKKSK